MAGRKRVRWQDVQNILRDQPGQQVVTSQYVVNIGAIEGGVVHLAARSRRREPPRMLPRQVSGFLDREQEQRRIGLALARGQLVDLHGPDGVGKTTLISQVMRTQLPGAFPDGMVYVSARRQTAEDLLQGLFESFFETDGSIKIANNDFRQYMVDKRALIAVDDANHLGKGQAEALAEALPQCAILIAGRQQQVRPGTAVAVALRGLPRDQAVTLFERHWDQIAARDRPVVEAICEALDNVPVSVIKTATTTLQHRLPLLQVLRQVQSPAAGRDSVAQVFSLVADRLSAEERRLLGAVAASGGAKISLEALPVITGLPLDECAEHLESLGQVGLVQADDSRYSLDDAFEPYVQAFWTDEAMQARAAEYYYERADQIRRQPEVRDEEHLLTALEYHFRRDQWEQVVHLARNLDGYLASTGKWGQWRMALAKARRAAIELGRWEAEARIQNYLGVIALGSGDTDTATKFFRGALAIQQAHGDRAGQKETLKNLRILDDAQPGGVTLDVRIGLEEEGPDRIRYNIGAIHELLTAAFSHQGLRRFCQSQPLFRPVLKDFSPQHGLNEMADRLIEYCDKKSSWEELLSAVQEESPRQYARFESALRVS